MGEMRLIENKEAQTRRKALRQEPDFDEDGIEIVQQEVRMENHGMECEFSIIQNHKLCHILNRNQWTNSEIQIDCRQR